MGKTATKDDITKAAAVYMLRRGLATVAEIATLSGRSRQIVHHWAKDCPAARETRLRKAWERAIRAADSRANPD